MKRTTVAVCVTGYDREYETRVVSGIYKRCKELDYNLLIFSNLMRRPELNAQRTLPPEIIHGEVEIYNLINYSLVDGIIILGDSMIEESVIADVSAKAAEHGITVVNVNDPLHPTDKNVILSDRRAMLSVMEHLVNEHGLRDINFIGGFPGNQQTEERLAAYKKVLAEHGIPIEEDRIAYGEFWKKAEQCTEDFIKSGKNIQAVVCASDTMAFFCMDCLKKHGYKIPDDIVVTGFDGIRDCELYSPTLTTVRRDFAGAGEAAVDIIRRVLDGQPVENETMVESLLVKNQSCGCADSDNKDQIAYFDTFYGEQNRYREFNTYIIEMNTAFSSAADSVQLYNSLVKGAEFFKLKKMFVCICANVERGIEKDLSRGECSSLSEAMVSMFRFGHNVPEGTLFPASDFIPQPLLDNKEAAFMAFSPMYFKNRFLGYIAYQPPDDLFGTGDLFGIWLLSLSNNAGSFYMNNELEFVIDELENLYIRDPLTGLYNRRGMDRLGAELIARAKAHGERVTVICADIDNLKPINDRYGHEEGDNAIVQTAKAILSAMPEGSVCTRTGGDEFCIIAAHTDDADIEKYIQAIDAYLRDYNASSGLPYSVGCSCGYSGISSEGLISLEHMAKLADKNMYEVKFRKKKSRGN